MREGQEQSHRYYIYSWNPGKPYGVIRIHVAECSYCNDGRGTLYGPTKARGDWRGPFDFESAFRLVKSLAAPDTRTCQRCMAWYPEPTPKPNRQNGVHKAKSAVRSTKNS
jgi:hypothetical protein